MGIWDSPEVNAFCTGPSKNSSLVAVSTGILRRMDRAELEGVLGHELSHAANGDMVTMTLIQGVVNTFVFIASVINTNFLRGDRDNNRGFSGFLMRQLVFNLVHTVLGLLAFLVVVGPFSRLREFRADAGGAALAGKAKMIAGLQALLGQEPPAPARPGPPGPRPGGPEGQRQPQRLGQHPPLPGRPQRPPQGRARRALRTGPEPGIKRPPVARGSFLCLQGRSAADQPILGFFFVLKMPAAVLVHGHA